MAQQNHTSEKRWPEVSTSINTIVRQLLHILNQGEEGYLQMVEIFTWAGGTDQGLADLLFKDVWSKRDTDGDGNMDTGANAEEVQMVADAKQAMTAIHDLFQCMNNVAVPQEDRGTQLRRMA